MTINDANQKPIKIYGARFKPAWSLPLMRDSIKKNIFNDIPKDIDMLLTHVPSNKNKLNITCSGKPKGSTELTEIIDSDHFTKLKIHCFGHNHNKRGFYHEESTDRLFINGVSVVGEAIEENIVQPFVFDF